MNKRHVVVKAEALCKSYLGGQHVSVLNNVSLVILEGETIAILGPSGVGKSTLLNILGTLEQPTSGSLEIGAININKANLSALRNHHIGFIFQSYHLLEEYTALENVLMPAHIARKSTKEHSPAKLRALMLLEKVGMSHRAHFLTKLLSGGEKQRIALARAFCNDPELILADEPTGNLDEYNSKLIHRLLIDCAKSFKKALVVVTHDQELAKLCDRRFLLKEGVLQAIE